MRERKRVSAICLALVALWIGPLQGLSSAAPKGVEVVRAAIPEYPAVARRAGVNGTVEVTATVDANGGVLATVAKSSNPLFDAAAVQAAQKWRLALGQGKTATLVFRFSTLPGCSVPSRVAIYSPPFAVEVFAAQTLGGGSDSAGQEPLCSPVELVEAPVQ